MPAFVELNMKSCKDSQWHFRVYGLGFCMQIGCRKICNANNNNFMQCGFGRVDFTRGYSFVAGEFRT